MIRAYVTDDRFGFGVRIGLILHPAEGSMDAAVRLLRLGDGSGFARSWDEVEAGAEASPTLILGDEEARALLEGLMRYYHGAEDTRALRHDYDAERKRVDKLTDAMCGLATTLAQPQVTEVRERHAP